MPASTPLVAACGSWMLFSPPPARAPSFVPPAIVAPRAIAATMPSASRPSAFAVATEAPMLPYCGLGRKPCAEVVGTNLSVMRSSTSYAAARAVSSSLPVRPSSSALARAGGMMIGPGCVIMR